MNSDDTRGIADNCFVCGSKNTFGLRIKFRLDGEICRAEFTPNERHQGYDNILHGGVLFSILDDVMANCLFLNGVKCYSARSEIRYRSPVEIFTPLRFEGFVEKTKKSFVFLRGLGFKIKDDQLIAEVKSTFVKKS
tara:strand:- start:2709 stop:3116 length:408 start_codon:yes stop_codon:yes gene_type:complete